VTAEREAERAVAVVGEEPVVPRPQLQAGGHEHRFVPRAADLEEDLAAVPELDLLVVDLPRQEHRAIRREQVVGERPPCPVVGDFAPEARVAAPLARVEAFMA
jgi:hypothetical protein